jgi:hypothetical protein
VDRDELDYRESIDSFTPKHHVNDSEIQALQSEAKAEDDVVGA